jgi:hypothetical protein
MRLRESMLCVCLVLAPAILTAQVNFGPLGGLNLSNLKGSPQDFSTRTGFSGGILLNPQFTEWFGLQLERVLRAEGRERCNRIRRCRVGHVRYASAPRLFRSSATSQPNDAWETARGFLHVGTAVATTLRCTVALYTDTGQLIPTDDCNGATGQALIKSVDWSFSAGIGFDMRPGNGASFGEPGQAITLEFRFLNGFRPIGQSAPAAVNPAKNRV